MKYLQGNLLWPLMAALCMNFAAPLVSAAGLDIDGLFPAGGQRGATFEATVSGKFPKWPVRAWVDHPGVTVTAGAEKGKLTVTVAADAAVGSYWIRFHDDDAVSEPQSFMVGLLPEILEQEPNNEPSKAHLIGTLPVVVNGRLAASGDADLFAVPLQKGQTLVAALEANETLGSPLDGVLQIVGPRGNVLGYNHDTHGLDPRIVFVAPTDGTYCVRTFAFPSKPNQTIGFAGGAAYVYRLTVTTGAFVDYPWPLAVTRGRESRVELFGWNISDALKSVMVHPDGERADIVDPLLANTVSLAVVRHNAIVEIEPNDAAMPQPIELPVTVTGRIEHKRDVDLFSFTAKQAEPLVFQLESRALGYPLDAVLEVTDATGKSLIRVDDSNGGRDALLAFSPPADGQYRIAVSDLNRQGSSRHIYRLRAARAEPDFEIGTDAHAYTVVPGKPTDVSLTINRLSGFDEDIALRVTGLPDFVTAASTQSAAKGDSAKAVKLTLSASGGTFSGPIRIVGEAAGTSKLVRDAAASIPSRPDRVRDLWLTVAAAPK